MFDDALTSSIAAELRRLADEIERFPNCECCEVRLSFSEIYRSFPAEQLRYLIEWSEDMRANRFLYQFTLAEGVNPEPLHAAYRKAKEQKRADRAYARLNAPSSTLYVGSSRSLETRIKQHLGYGNGATFAMQLAHWLPDTPDELILVAMLVEDEVSQELIQIIEDGLWKVNLPMLGRQGAR